MKGIFFLLILLVFVSFTIPVFGSTASVVVASGSSVPECEETNDCYIPSEIHIEIGDTVNWKNADSAAHTVTSGTPEQGPDGIFDSSLLMAGSSYNHTFESAGTFDYFCMVHPWMVATIFVEGKEPQENNFSTYIPLKVTIEGPTTLYLDQPVHTVRALVEIRDFRPNDGYYFMKVVHIKSGEVLRDSEILPRYAGNDLWTAPIAFNFQSSEITPSMIGEYQIQIRTEFGKETANAKFSILEPQPKSTEESSFQSDTKESNPRILITFPKNEFIIGNDILIDIKLTEIEENELVALTIKDSKGNVDSQSIEIEPNSTFRYTQKIPDDSVPGIFQVTASSIINGQRYSESSEVRVAYDIQLDTDQQNQIDIHLHRANAFLTFNYLYKAQEEFEEVLKIDSGNVEAMEGKEIAENQIQFLKNVIETAGDDFDPQKPAAGLFKKGSAHVQLREFEQGYKFCKEGLILDSNSLPGFTCAEMAAIGLEKYDEVLALYQDYPHITKVLDPLSPLSLSVTQVKGKYVALYQLERFDDLLADIDNELDFAESGPPRDLLLILKALALEKTGNSDESEQYFNRANPNFAPLSRDEYMGSLYFLFRDYEKSVDYWSDSESEEIAFAKVIANYELEKDLPTLQISDEIEDNPGIFGGGCLIATATFDSELAPQVQQLRELRDTKLLQTQSGTKFIQGFNEFYYSFSPAIADYERENPVFKEAVKITIIPMISSLSILNNLDLDSEAEVLGAGISVITLNIGMYIAAPALIGFKVHKHLKSRK